MDRTHRLDIDMDIDDTTFRWDKEQWLRINEIRAQSWIKYLEQCLGKANTGAWRRMG
jgi:hypothetical protein